MNFRGAAQRNWDAVVVGAGPAGTVSARQLALAGAEVLLVDKAPLGRWKVCGCCLNGAAIQTLNSISLNYILEQSGAVPLAAIRVAARSCQATLGLSGASLSREAFDAALVGAAVAAGATFLPQTQATLGETSSEYREVVLVCDHKRTLVNARVVLAADGLGGNLLAHGAQHRAVVRSNSRMGAGMIADTMPSFVEPGTIYMACAKSGYVGLVRLEDGRVNVAAALDIEQVRAAGSPGPLAAQILEEVGWHVGNAIAGGNWRGTPALTRRAEQLACERVLVLGDAAGYVEPFTGEGMAWALASAVAVTPLALEASRRWSPQVAYDWEQLYRGTIACRQFTCRQVAWGLRHPLLTRMAIKLVDRHPRLAGPVIRRLNTQ
jgi:flavin-dependent dehydrogenase